MRISNTAERLSLLMTERGLKQVDILRLAAPYCRSLGATLTKVDLSQYLSGKYEPKQVKLNILALALNVSEAWLMGYDVPMERTAPSVKWDAAIEQKLSHVGFSIGFYEEDAMLWINYPDGTLEVTDTELQELNESIDSFIRFKLEELKAKHIDSFRKKN